MTTPLLLLRAVQLGVQIGEMDLLTIGTINDMYTEMQNDENQGGGHLLTRIPGRIRMESFNETVEITTSSR